MNTLKVQLQLQKPWRPRFQLACAQMEVGRDLKRNLQVVLKQIQEAAKDHGAQLVVFPETALSGYGPTHWPKGCAEIDFKTLKAAEKSVQAAAKKRNIAVLIGTTARVKSSFFNSAILFGPDGKHLLRYDKMHLTGEATNTLDKKYYAKGSHSKLKKVMVSKVPVGVQICLDMRYPEPWRLLALAGARIFLHPTAAFGRDQLWKREAVESNLSSRCSENGCWLASANSSGPFQYLSSRIIDPDGLTIVQAQDDTEEVISAAIDPDFKGRGNFVDSRRTDSYSLTKIQK